jgi:hypothetical protein
MGAYRQHTAWVSEIAADAGLTARRGGSPYWSPPAIVVLPFEGQYRAAAPFADGMTRLDVPELGTSKNPSPKWS